MTIPASPASHSEDPLLRAWPVIFDRVLDSTQSGIMITDPNQPDNPLVYVNTYFSHITGYSMQESVGRNCRFLQGDEPRQAVLDELRDAIQEGREFHGTLRNVRKNGEHFWNELTVSPVFDIDQKLLYFVGISNDVTEHVQTRYALEDSNRLLSSIVENIPNMVFLKDAKGLRFQLFNKEAETLLGFVREQMIGKNDHDFFPLEQADFFTQKDRETLNKKVLEDIPEEYIDTLYKGRRILHTKKVPILDEEGNPLYLLGISEDITQQKQMEEDLKHAKENLEVQVEQRTRELAETNEELKKRERLLRQVVDSNMLGILFLKMEGQITDANDAMLKMLGYTREELETGTLSWTQLTPPELLYLDEARIPLMMETGYCPPFEKQYIHKDGHRIDILIGGAVIQDSSEHDAVAFILDITKQKAAEQEIRKNLAREKILRQVIETVSKTFDIKTILETVTQELIQFFDTDRCVVLLNEPPDHLGNPKMKLVAQAIRAPNVLPVRQEDIPAAAIREYHKNHPISHHHAIGFITSQSDASGAFRAYLDKYQIRSSLIIELAYRNILYGRVVLHDCHRDRAWQSEEKILFANIVTHLGVAMYQSELYQHEQMAKQEAENANRRKDLFLASMSHELRTPLNAIIGFSEMLEQGLAGPINEKQTKYIQNVLASGHHLLQVVNDILDIAKIESGTMSIEAEWTPIRPLLLELTCILEETARKQSIRLVTDISSQVTQVYADPARLKQVLYNLIHNAIKFNVPNGSVFIRVFPSPDNQSILFEIEDTGIGIPEDQLPKLFREFFQVDTRLARKHEGTGLGLALSKKMVEGHGGSINVESHIGKGSIFRFSIPNPAY